MQVNLGLLGANTPDRVILILVVPERPMTVESCSPLGRNSVRDESRVDGIPCPLGRFDPGS